MFLLRFLGALASLHIAFGRVLAWIYRKVWNRAPLHWFDHRFDLLRGPAFWIWQERGDVVQEEFPGNDYDVVLCFSALQQMSRTQLDTLLPKIREALKAGGTFFGSVSLLSENNLLRTEDQVRPEFTAHFKSVELNRSPWPNGRTECYFRCHN